MYWPRTISARLSCRWTRLLLLCLLLSLWTPDFRGQANTPELSATGNITSKSITTGELLGFTINLRNKSKVTLTSIKLVRAPDDYQFSAVSVLTPQQKTIGLTNFSPANDVLVSSLDPGQSITVWGYLKPSHSHRTATLEVTLSWTLPAGSSGSIPLVLGDNQVRAWYEAQWISDLEKILAVPLVLAIITAFITYSSSRLAKEREQREEDRRQRIEDAKKEADEERERKLAEAEKEKERVRTEAEKRKEIIRTQADRAAAVRTEVWKQMLPVSHRYAAKFYLPLSTAAERLVQSLQDWQKSRTVEKKKICFFYLLFVGKRMTVTRNRIGGFYFKDLRGEELASSCWQRQRRALLGKESSPFHLAVRACIDLVAPRETYETFAERFEDTSSDTITWTDDQMQLAWTYFDHWLTRQSRVNYVALHLHGFFLIVDYESNRPYENWYDIPMPLRLTEGMEKQLRKLLAKRHYDGKQVDTYFANRVPTKK